MKKPGFISYFWEHPLAGGLIRKFFGPSYKTMIPIKKINFQQLGFKIKMKNTRMIVITASLTLLFLIGLSAAFIVLEMKNPFDRQAIAVDIYPGMGSIEISRELKNKGILRGTRGFNFIVSKLGLSGELKAGRYELSPSMPLVSILNRLLNGGAVLGEKVTFPEGASIYKMARVLEGKNIALANDFEGLVECRDIETFKKQYAFLNGIPNYSLEGYLFPDTYFISKDASLETLTGIMLSRFSRVVMPFWNTAEANTELSLHQIMTLASIIEKEAARPDERAIISSVYHNRLKINMKLDACPTVKYALERPSKKVFLNQLEVKSPYNTYKYVGLPPGPICNPGLGSIAAAVYPANTNYLYFVARKDGTHIFSENFDAHKKARESAKKI